MHEQFLVTTLSLGTPPWTKLSAAGKAKYRRVAKAMLESPPMVLVEAVRRHDRWLNDGKEAQQ